MDTQSARPNTASRERAHRWVALLPKIALGVLALAIIIAIVFWLTATGSVGQDVSILTLCIAFTIMIALMSLRELLKEGEE